MCINIYIYLHISANVFIYRSYINKIFIFWVYTEDFLTPLGSHKHLKSNMYKTELHTIIFQNPVCLPLLSYGRIPPAAHLPTLEGSRSFAAPRSSFH